jgi:hypothetical protein
LDSEAFQQQTIDRLARMETRQEDMYRRQDALFEKIDSMVQHCNGEADRLTSIEGTLYGSTIDKEDRGLVGDVSDVKEDIGKVQDRVQNLTIKTVLIGFAVGCAGAAGINLSGWLQQ